MHSACSKNWINVWGFTLYHVEGQLKLLKFQHWHFSWLQQFNFRFWRNTVMRQKSGAWVISHLLPAACSLSHISYAYFKWVAMLDRFFWQRAYIGITRSCIRWYVRKKFLTWADSLTYMGKGWRNNISLSMENFVKLGYFESKKVHQQIKLSLKYVWFIAESKVYFTFWWNHWVCQIKHVFCYK